MSKTVWMISGNKGGVGKSLFCLALASALEIRGDHFAILDGDERVRDVYDSFARKCPARFADFRNLNPGSPNCLYDGNYETILLKLLKASDNLIINTPDGADNILMKWFDVTLRHTESTNCQFKFIYLMSERQDGLDILPELIKRFSFLYPVRNLHFGNAELFTEFNRKYAPMFREIVSFPVLRGEELRMFFDVKTYPAEALRLKDSTGCFTVPALSRSRILAWQSLFMDEIESVIDNKEEPNIRVRVDDFSPE